jgi:hypothetical protein
VEFREEGTSMYSQFGQDLFVLEVLRGMRGGFFLDSGAADGISYSNTLLLESLFGWRGICIEPNEHFFAALLKNRHCRCLKCCLYDKEGSVDFLESAEGMGGILSEYDPSHLKYAETILRIPTNRDGRPTTVSKVTRTIRSVLRECGAPSVIDYWSLDTEGSEFSIMQSFPFDEYSFRVLTVEHNWTSARDKMKEFLETRGYFRIRAMEIDDCYVRDVDFPVASWQSSAWKRLRTHP